MTTPTKPRSRKAADKPVADTAAVATDKAAVVAENTAAATKAVDEFIGNLPVFTMKKKNNEWFATIDRATAKTLTSKVGIVRLYNSGHPSVQFVTVEFAETDIAAGVAYFRVGSNLLKK